MITGLAGAKRGSKLPRDWPSFASILGNAISLFLVKYLFNVTLLSFLLKETLYFAMQGSTEVRRRRRDSRNKYHGVKRPIFDAYPLVTM